MNFNHSGHHNRKILRYRGIGWVLNKTVGLVQKPSLTSMETTRKTSRKTTTSTREKIVAAFKKSVLSSGSPPVSVYSFCMENGLKEEDFYSNFGSFQGLERKIWKDLMDATISRLTRDKAFRGFSAREKVLALFYTLMEELVKDRSYTVFQLNTLSKLDIVPAFLRDFRRSEEHTSELQSRE